MGIGSGVNWLLRHPHLFLAFGGLCLLLGIMSIGIYVLIRPQRVEPRAAASLPATGFDHAPFGALLERFVSTDGEVDYAGWHADAEASSALEGYLANLAAASPHSAPARFPSPEARLAYWLNAYNACVIAGVLRHWPLKSVHEVQGPAEITPGFGFFARLEFDLGGDWMTLHHLEQSLIRVEFSDPRVHFVLNCASGGCPPIRPQLPLGPKLEERLASAARAFVNDPAQIEVDVATKRVRVSSIFVWYESDFTAALQRRGLPPSEQTLLRYLEDLAEPALAAQLREARTAGFEVEALDYDWSLNGR